MYYFFVSKFLRIILLTITIYTNNVAFSNNDSKDFYKHFQSVFDLIDKHYFKEPDKQRMIDSAINGVLCSLDKYSNYLFDEDLEDFLNQTEGEFGGIGVEINYRKELEAIEVISPIDNLPASRIGIKAGDFIVGVNNELVSNLGFFKSVRLMKGDPGSKVKLLVIRDKEQNPIEFEITREIVHVNPIKGFLSKDNIAYIKIIMFNKNTIDELRKTVKSLESQIKDNRGLCGIILDLRNNPGGLLNQAVSVGEYFIDSGVIVITKGKRSEDNKVYTANKLIGKAPKVPLIVMINAGSASASEIVAGSLQDHKRAIILGTKSYGKASVQSLIKVSSRSAIKLTTARYYTPNGRLIEDEGIKPDINIEQTNPINIDLKNPEEKRFSELYLNKYISGKHNNIKNIDKSNQIFPEDVSYNNLYKIDYQFARAYDLIIGILISNRNCSL